MHARNGKIAQYIPAVQKGNLEADLDLLPGDKFEREEKAEQEAETIKPTQKRRTAQRAGKTKPDNAPKPLQESEMEGEEAADSSQEETGSVRLGQTNLAPISPIDPISPIPPEEDSGARADFE
jgi:hypothetical protein